jgi:hypothetical protein
VTEISDLVCMIDLTPHQLRVVAAAACCHPATVKRYLADKPIRSTCRERITQALASSGIVPKRLEIQPAGVA